MMDYGGITKYQFINDWIQPIKVKLVISDSHQRFIPIANIVIRQIGNDSFDRTIEVTNPSKYIKLIHYNSILGD